MKSIVAQIKTIRNNAHRYAVALRNNPKTQYHTVMFITEAVITGAILAQGKRISEAGAPARTAAGILVPTAGIFAIDDLSKIILSVDEYHREQSTIETSETN